MRNNKGPNTDPGGPTDSITEKLEYEPFRTTRCCLFNK